MSDDHIAAALTEHLTACADEYIGDPDAEWRPDGITGPIFVPDGEVTEGPVVLVRRSDGARFYADVSVVVWPAR